LFGEDQARYLIALDPKEAESVTAEAHAKGVPVLTLGATGGAALALPSEPPITLSALTTAFETPLPAYMSGDDGAFAR
jgi:phosphoribosylformylglycinamidine synthase